MAGDPVVVKFGVETGEIKRGSQEASSAVQQSVSVIQASLNGMAESTRNSVNRAVQALSGSGGLTDSLNRVESKFALVGSATSKMLSAFGYVGAIGTFTSGMIAAGKAASDLEQSLFQMERTFGKSSDTMIARARAMAQQMSHYFSNNDIMYAFNKTADSMMRYGIQGQQYLDLVSRASDVAAAKGMNLKESIDRIESAMRGEAEASEYLGVTLNDTYMKTIAFDGALKDYWETMAETSKAQYRYAELMNQTQKYTGSAALATETFTGALQSFWNTLKDRIAPALSSVNSGLARFIGLMRDAISGPSVEELKAKALGVITAKSGYSSEFMGLPFGRFGPTESERQAASMDYRDLMRLGQVGNGGPAGSLPAPVIDPEKQMKAWKNALESQSDALIVSGRAKELSLQKDYDYWSGILKNAKEGSEEAKLAYHELAQVMDKLDKEREKESKKKGKSGAASAAKEAREQYQADIAEMRLALEKYRDNGEERVRIARQMAARAEKEYGKESAEYMRMCRVIEQEEQRHQAHMAQLAEIESDRKKEIAMSEIDMRADEISTLRHMGQINAQEEIRMLIELENRKHQIEWQAMQDRMRMQDKDVIEQARTYRQLEQLQLRHNLRVRQYNNQMRIEQNRTWNNIADTIKNTFGQAITGVLTGTTTMADAMRSIFSSLISFLIELLLEWVAQQIMSLFIVKETTMSQAMANAAVGATAAGQSVAAIPYWGWAAAPGVAAGTYAMLMGYAASIPAAAGGWDVERDSLALIHQKEMVLPATLSERIRNMTEPSGRGATLNVHVKANDARSFERQLQRSDSALTRIFKRQVRQFQLRPARA